MSSNTPQWISSAMYDCATHTSELEQTKRNVSSIQVFMPETVDQLTVREQRAFLKELVARGLFVCKRIPDTREECINMVMKAIHLSSPNMKAYEQHSLVRRSLGTAPSGSLLKLGFQDKNSIDRLLTHITHLRRFRATVNPLHEFMQPVCLIKFEKKESSSSLRDTEYRAYVNNFTVPNFVANERYVLRLFGQRVPFQFQVSNVERKEIPKYVADDFGTVAPNEDKYDGNFMDPAFAKYPHLAKHPGARGNNPVVFNQDNYPSASEDYAAYALLQEGTVLPWTERLQGRICVWLNAKPVDIPVMEFKKYTTRLTNQARKKAMPLLEGVDLTVYLKTHTPGTKISFEIAWSREDLTETDKNWVGVAIVEKIRVLTETQLISIITNRPNTELLPSVDMSFNIEEEQKKRPRECFHCKASAETKPEIKLCRCSGCHFAWYCGREHQVEDWPNHRAECNRIFRIVKAQKEANALALARQEEDDLQVDNSKVKVPLECAMTSQRMKYPIKGIKCTHHTCSDLQAHISLVSAWGNLQCMQCYEPMLMEDIAISQRMYDAIKRMPDSIVEVTCPDNMPYQAVVPAQTTYNPPKKTNTGQNRPQEIVTLGTPTIATAPPTITQPQPPHQQPAYTNKPIVDPNEVIELD